MAADEISDLPELKADLGEARQLLSRLEDRKAETDPDRYERLRQRYEEQIEELEPTVEQLVDEGKTRKLELEDRLAHQQDKAREAKGELEEIEALYEEGAMGEEAYREDRRRLRRQKKEAESKVSEIEREIDEVEFYLTETGEVSYRTEKVRGQAEAVVGELSGKTKNIWGRLRRSRTLLWGGALVFVLGVAYWAASATSLTDELFGSAPPQKGLVAHYPFDEESSIGPNISLHGGPNTVHGIKGQALHFDGSREYAIVDAHNRTLDLASPEMRTNFTISAWFKTNEDGGGILGVMGGEEPTYPDGHDRHIYVGGGDVRMRVWDQNSYELKSGLKRYDDGEWHNAVMVVKKDDGIYGYVDGKRIDSNLNHDRSGFTGVKGGWSPLHLTIGYSNDSTFFEGRIDEVRIYNRALSVSQIKKIYETSK